MRSGHKSLTEESALRARVNWRILACPHQSLQDSPGEAHKQTYQYINTWLCPRSSDLAEEKSFWEHTIDTAQQISEADFLDHLNNIMLYKKWEKINKRLDPSFKNRITHLQVYICIEKKKTRRKSTKRLLNIFISGWQFYQKAIIFFFILLFYNK